MQSNNETNCADGVDREQAHHLLLQLQMFLILIRSNGKADLQLGTNEFCADVQRELTSKTIITKRSKRVAPTGKIGIDAGSKTATVKWIPSIVQIPYCLHLQLMLRVSYLNLFLKLEIRSRL